MDSLKAKHVLHKNRSSPFRVDCKGSPQRTTPEGALATGCRLADRLDRTEVVVALGDGTTEAVDLFLEDGELAARMVVDGGRDGARHQVGVFAQVGQLAVEVECDVDPTTVQVGQLDLWNANSAVLVVESDGERHACSDVFRTDILTEDLLHARTDLAGLILDLHHQVVVPAGIETEDDSHSCWFPFIVNVAGATYVHSDKMYSTIL